MNYRGFFICLMFVLIYSIGAAAGNLPVSECIKHLEAPWKNDRTSVEHAVWSSVCDGRTADLSKKAAHDRLVTNDFLRTILTQKRYVEAIPHTGVRINGATFNGSIDLQGIRFSRPLVITGSQFKKSLNMDNARFDEVVVFSESVFEGAVSALRAHFDGGLDLSGSVAVSIWFDHVQAKKAVRFDGAIVTDKLLLRGGQVDGLVSIAALNQESPSTFEHVALTSTRITGPLHLSGAIVGTMLDLNDVTVDDSIVARAISPNFWSQFSKVDLTGASISGQLDFRGVIVTDDLQMNSINVGQHLLMNSLGHRASFNSVSLTGAKIAGELSLIGTEVNGLLSLNSAQIGRNVLLHALPCNETRDTIPSSFAEIDAKLISVGGGIAFQASHFNGPVRVDNASINKGFGLLLDDPETDNATKCKSTSGTKTVPHPIWGEKAFLSLRGARAGTVQDISEGVYSSSWPQKMELHGFEFAHWHTLESAGANPKSTRSTLWYKNWLEADETFTSHPYLHLARLLERNESIDAAREIRILLDDIRRNNASGLDWLWLTALKFTVCYGHNPFLALAWAAVLIVISMIVLEYSGERKTHGMKYGFSYSLDLLLPVIQLDKRHYESIRLKDGVRHAYYVYMIAGYVLFGFVIAGLARVTE